MTTLMPDDLLDRVTLTPDGTAAALVTWRTKPPHVTLDGELLIAPESADEAQQIGRRLRTVVARELRAADEHARAAAAAVERARCVAVLEARAVGYDASAADYLKQARESVEPRDRAHLAGSADAMQRMAREMRRVARELAPRQENERE